MFRPRFAVLTLITLGALALGSLGNLTPAHAGTAKKKKPAEIYPATEDGQLPLAQALGGTDESSDGQNAFVEAVVPPSSKARVTVLAAPYEAVAPAPPVGAALPPIFSASETAPLPVAVAPPPLSPPTLEAAYDAVPDDQTNPLVVRIQLVEKLVRKYNRAYDYRSHTIKELETILKHLDEREARS